MKKRWISACLAALLLCGTAGCTAQQAPGQTTPEQGEPSEPAQTEQTAPVEEMAQKTQQQAYAEVIQGLVNEFGVIDQKSAREIYDENADYRGLISILQYDLTGDGQDELIVLYASPDVGASQSETLGQDIHIEIYTFDGEKAVQLYAKYNFIASMGVSNVSVCSVSGQNVLFSASTRHFTDHILYYKDGELLDAVDSDAPFSKQEQQIYDEGIQHGLSGEGAALNEIHLQRAGLDYDTLQYIYGFSSDSGTFGLSEYEALQQALQDFGIKIPKKVVSAQTLLEDIAYLGDRSKCKMDTAMARAYADAISSLPATTSDGFADYAVHALLLDPANDGMPYLCTAYIEESSNGMNSKGEWQTRLCLWTWDGTAVQRYPFEKDLESDYVFGTDFGTWDGRPALRAGDGVAMDMGSYSGFLYYTVGNAQLHLADHLMYYSAFYDAGQGYLYGGRMPLVDAETVGDTHRATLDAVKAAGWELDAFEFEFNQVAYLHMRNDEPISREQYEQLQQSFVTNPTFEIVEASTGGSFEKGSWADGADTAEQLRAYADAAGRPVYDFPEVSHMFTDGQLQQIAELFAEKLNGEIGEIYQMSEDLYYIVIYIDGKVSGCAAVKQTMQGFRLVSTETEAASEDALHALVQQDQQTANITLDYNAAGEDKAGYLAEALQTMDGTVVNDAAKGEIAAYMENAVTESSVTDVKCRRNAATIDADTIAQSLSQAQAQKDALDQTLTGVTLNKTVRIVLRIVCTGLDEGEPVQVTFDPSMLEALGDAQCVQVMLGDAQHSIAVDTEALTKLCQTHGKLIVQVQQQDGKYVISLLDGEQNPLDKLSESLTFTLPAESETATVLASYEGGSDNWGGQYDGINRTIEFTTPYSGTYEVIENASEIVDLADCAEQTAAAIRFMVSKGYFSVDDAGNFDPNGTLNRYTFAEALVRMFFALDRSLTTSFTDVAQDSPYYAYVASGEQDDIIEGFEDNTFRGETDVLREQVIALCSRTLVDKKGYSYPDDPAAYLTFADADTIADWARETTALAVRETLIDGTGTLAPQQAITRGEAALLLYRLFMLLYEPPVAEMAFDGFDSGSPVPAVALTLGGIAVLGGAGAVVYRRRKHTAVPPTDDSDTI